MNHFAPPRRTRGSLIERANAEYDFASVFDAPRAAEPRPPFVEEAVAPVAKPAPFPETAPPRPIAAAREPVAVPARVAGGAPVDRKLLTEAGMLAPGGPVSILAEEFRLVKRQLLLTARAIRKDDEAKGRTMLICSAKPDEGKTYCAINLAISLAAERETEVLLVDGDLAKPDVLKRLGIPAGPGLLDALADSRVDVESLVVRTDVPQLSVLSAGTASNDDTELLASERTGAVIARLLAADPRRIILFDSPPALAASPASVLALLAGQIMLVVRADKTPDSDLRAAVSLLDGCQHIQLVLNQVAFTPGASRFGSYYGTEYAK